MSSVRIAGAVAVVATLGCALAPDVASAAAGTRCGTKELYGKRLTIRVLGRRIPCAEVRQIVRGSCRAGRVWSCFSFRPPDPLLVWFPESELFAERWSTTIEARRTPCGEARVTAKVWAAARRLHAAGFPSREQVLADDLIRCRQLRGKGYRTARRLLGRPDEHSVANGRRYADWLIGDQRDSFFQLDSEYLSLVFRPDGVLESAGFAQG